MSANKEPKEPKEPAPTLEVPVSCQDCGHKWIGLYLPQPIHIAAKIAKNMTCPKCGAGSKHIFLGK